MRELLLLDFGNMKYGVWKDEVQAVKDIQTLHRVPLTPACIAGMSILDGRTVTLADLSVCIGLPPLTRERPGRVLILSEQEKLTGFVVEGEITPVTVAPGAILPMPGYLKSPVIDACVLYESRLVPVINITALYNRVQKSDREPPVPGFEVRKAEPSNIFTTAGIRVFECGGELFAAPAEGTAEAVEPGRVARLALVPQYVQGIVHHRESVLPLIHLSRRMKLIEKGSGRVMLVARAGEESFGFLVDRDEGAASAKDFTIKHVPPVARSSWMQAAALLKGEVLPVIDFAALADVRPEGADEKPLSGRYHADSRFPGLFGAQDVEVMEFSLLGVRHAVPGSEVEATLPFRPYRQVPNAPPIVIGLAEHDGELLPVLDLAMCFGRRSLATPEWRMIIVKNGDFRALVITEAAFGKRLLARDEQRGVPIQVPHKVVYGCYPDAATVRLILNVEALTVHFDRSLVKDLLPALSREMEQAEAEIVPALFESGESKESRGPAASEEPARTAGREADTEIAGPVLSFGSVEQAEAGAGEAQAAAESGSGKHAELPVEEARSPEDSLTAHPGPELLPLPDRPEPLSQLVDPAEIRPNAKPYPEPEMRPESQREPAGIEQPDQPALHEEAGQADGLEKEAPAGMYEETERAPIPSEEVTSAKGPAVKEETEGEQVVQGQEVRGPREEAAFTGEADAEEKVQPEKPEAVTFVPEQHDKPASPPPVSQQAPAVLYEEFALATAGEILSTPASTIQKDERNAPITTPPVTDRELVKQEREIARPVAEYTGTPAVSAWKRRLAFGIAGAVLIGLLYASGVFERATGDRPVAVKEPQAVKAAPKAAPPVKAVQDKPEPVKPAVTPSSSEVYEVRKGDTLWAISKRFTGNPYNYPRVAKENEIGDPDLIFPGQRVRIKK